MVVMGKGHYCCHEKMALWLSQEKGTMVDIGKGHYADHEKRALC